MRGTHGWAEVSRERKRDIIDAIASGRATKGPVHLELDLTDRCNVDCYFCSQMDVRTKQQIPYERIVELLDETKANGLRSVRLAGGGDPLFHTKIGQVIDYIQSKELILDNITTNGLGLTPEIGQKLIAGKCREVLFSLNAADAADYARMMQVKPAIFDKVCANIRYLAEHRGAEGYPGVIIQFLLDKENYHKLPQMYALGRSLGADVIAVNLVLDIQRERIDHAILLSSDETEALRPYVREALIADRDAGLLQMCFAIPAYNEMLEQLKVECATEVSAGFTTAPAYKEKNGQCFFGWYSAVVRGNGDLYPCCLLLKPDYKPLGNAMTGSFSDQWNGPKFTQLRGEMREVMLAGGEMEFNPARFQTLEKECVNAYSCWLKNIYFRGDDEFYQELDQAMEIARKKEIRWVGKPRQILRAIELKSFRDAKFKSRYESLKTSTRRFRVWMKNKLNVNLSASEL